MLTQLIAKATTRGLRASLRNVLSELQINWMHQNGVRRARRLGVGKDLRVHFGCGSNVKKGFINVDFGPEANVNLDLREPLPFLDGSCSMVYSEHFLEHLGYPEEAMLFLKESLRILGPGGVFSVGVPDTEWPIRAYAGDPGYAGWFEYVRGAYPKSEWITTKMECVNHSFRQRGEHKFAYDFETLARALEMAGFVDARRRQFDPSLDSEASRYSLDSDGSKCTTLYVEARKPR